MSKEKRIQNASGSQKSSQNYQNDQSVVLNNKINFWCLFATIGITLIVFFPALFNGFVLNWDDAGYITEYKPIQSLSWQNIKIIFTSYHQGNYHPLTILTYAFEQAIVGTKPFLYHLDNIILHLLNVALVFIFTRKLTNKLEIVCITALLFGIHPLRVESVAWVSERKDVLYTFFFMLAGIKYIDYFQKAESKIKNLILSILFIILSLLSKPAAVCFPGVVILIDWFCGRKFSTKLILEKVPFFAISLIFGIVAIYSQKEIGAIQNLAPLFSFFERILLSFYALVLYFSKFLVPLGLSAMHPYPELVDGHLATKVYIAPIIVLALIVPVVYSFRKTKMIVFGTLFFFVNIALVLQLLPVGAAIIAERYSYIPYIGLFMMIAYGYSWISENKIANIKKIKPFIAIILCMWILCLGILSFNRINVWKRGDYLFEDILLNYKNQPFVYNNLGFICFNELKENDRALYNYNQCLAIDPDFQMAYGNRAILYFNTQKYPEALKDFDKALKYNPTNTDAMIGRANTLSSLNQYEKAIPDYDSYISIKPENPSAWHWRGIAKYNCKKYDDAITNFNKALELQPNGYESYYWRGLSLYSKGLNIEAISDLSKAINIESSKSEIYAWRGLMYYSLKNYNAAIADYTKALSINPNDMASLMNRVISYKITKEWNKALIDIENAMQKQYPVDRALYEEIKRNAGIK